MLEQNKDYIAIRDMIKTTNNGKLMIKNIPYPARAAVDDLVGRGLLHLATFIEPGDSVRLPFFV